MSPRWFVSIAVALCMPLTAQGQGRYDFEPFARPDGPAESTRRAESAEDEIETDRDSFTPATTLAGRRRTIVEAAYTFLDNRRVPDTNSLPELLVRYGVNDWFELRFGTNYEVGGAGNPVSANIPDDLVDEPELEEEANVSYGCKIGLYEQAGFVPRSAIIVQGATPTAGVAVDTHVSTTYITGWTLPSGAAFDSAVRFGTGSLDDDRFNVWSPSTVFKVPVGRRWKAHAEYFGAFSDGRARESVQHFFSPGAHCLLTPNLEVGLRCGWGLNDQTPNFFTNLGVGYRY